MAYSNQKMNGHDITVHDKFGEEYLPHYYAPQYNVDLAVMQFFWIQIFVHQHLNFPNLWAQQSDFRYEISYYIIEVIVILMGKLRL